VGLPRVTTPEGALLADATSTEIAARGPLILVVPLGSIEQHGAHLPLGTDGLLAEELCARLAAERSDVVVTPVVPFGASGEHEGFAGTVSLGSDVLSSVLTEITRSARFSFRGVVFVSGHGGNAEAMARSGAVAEHEGDVVMMFLPRIDGADAHAGLTETSVVLAIDPRLVRNDEAMPGVTAPLSEIADALRSGGVLAVSPNGVLGDPTGATAVEGRRVVASLAAQLSTAVAARFDA